MKAFVFVRLKPDILDAPGRALGQQLVEMGYGEVRASRIGKVIELDLDIGDPKTVHDRLTKMMKEILSNPVIEDCSYQIEE